MKLKTTKTQRIRRITQIVVFILVALIAVSKTMAEAGVVLPLLPNASLHAVCPFGGVVTIYEFITNGTFIQKIHSSAFILMSLGMLVALLFGAIFCGYLCPFGTFQEWLGKLGKKIFPNRYNRIVPPKLDRVLRYLRYFVLILVLLQTARTTQLIFQNVDPYYALFHFFTSEVAISAYIVLGIIAVSSLFIERPWCKYVCPYGALLGIFNTFRIFKIRRNPDSCINCGKCNTACPMGIQVSGKKIIRNHQCISCYQCTSDSACPVTNTVTISTSKQKEKEVDRV